MIRSLLLRLCQPTYRIALESEPAIGAFVQLSQIRAARERARELGFELQGHIHCSGWSEPVIEAWYHPQHRLQLELTDAFYVLRSRLTEARVVETFSHSNPQTAEHERLVVRGGSGGGLAEDLSLHVDTVDSLRQEPVALNSLEAFHQDLVRYHAQDMPILKQVAHSLRARVVLGASVAALAGSLVLLVTAGDVRPALLALVGVMGFMIVQVVLLAANPSVDRAQNIAGSLGYGSVKEMRIDELTKAVQPTRASRRRAQRSSARDRCAYCQNAVLTGQPNDTACVQCLLRHHTSCWTERTRCAGCGGTSRYGAAVSATPENLGEAA
jgi:hypothetical protein